MCNKHRWCSCRWHCLMKHKNKRRETLIKVVHMLRSLVKIYSFTEVNSNQLIKQLENIHHHDHHFLKQLACLTRTVILSLCLSLVVFLIKLHDWLKKQKLVRSKRRHTKSYTTWKRMEKKTNDAGEKKKRASERKRQREAHKSELWCKKWKISQERERGVKALEIITHARNISCFSIRQQ